MIIRFRALLLRVEILKFIAALFSLFVVACDPQNPSFEELDAYLSQNNTDAIIIIQNGEVVHERYFGTFTQSEKHNGYSLAKSFTNAAIGMALYEGNIKSLESDVFSLLPNYAEFESRGLTVEHLLQMQSGIKFLNKEHYAPMMDSADSLGYIADIPVEASPGELWRYKTDPTLLSGIIEQTTGQTLHDYIDERLFEPMGIGVLGK
jgi:CubicO group peptidase (beta-lactamase class C family)